MPLTYRVNGLTFLAGNLLTVFGELMSVYSSVQCVYKTNIFSFLACGLKIFSCEASNSNLGLFKIRFTDFHRLYEINDWTIFARTLPLPYRIIAFFIYKYLAFTRLYCSVRTLRNFVSTAFGARCSLRSESHSVTAQLSIYLYQLITLACFGRR